MLPELRCWHPLAEGHAETSALGTHPAAAAPPLAQRAELTPQPGARQCYQPLQLERGLALEELRVHGSFTRIRSVLAAPLVMVPDVAALCRCDCVCRQWGSHCCGLAAPTLHPVRAAALPSDRWYCFPSRPLCSQCQDVHIEALGIVFHLPAVPAGAAPALTPAQQLAAAWVEGPVAWRRCAGSPQ